MSTFWQEESEETDVYTVPDDIVDLLFKVSCRSLPLEHAYALSTALHNVLPWLADEPRAGVHLIHGAESGNGWIRPEAPDELMYLSRRARLTLRLPKQRIDDARLLDGKTLDIAGNVLGLSDPNVRPLSNLTTIFTRYLVSEHAENDEDFLSHAMELLQEKRIRVKKMMSGRIHTITLPEGRITARSLMLDGMTTEESVLLQQEGLGEGRRIGCGLFLPHKGIAPVKSPS